MSARSSLSTRLLHQELGQEILFKVIVAIIVCGAIVGISGCAPPSLSLTPVINTGPTVAQLQDHLICLLDDIMDKHLGTEAAHKRDRDDFDLWYMMIKYNFFYTVNLTLFVTEFEGFNPSVNYIKPLTSFGNQIQNVVELSNGINTVTNATANTYNLTFAVGFQLNGLQDRNFLLNYTIDMHKLYDYTYIIRNNDPRSVSYKLPPQRGMRDWCNKVRNLKLPNGISYGLEGDLALEETLDSGLTG